MGINQANAEVNTHFYYLQHVNTKQFPTPPYSKLNSKHHNIMSLENSQKCNAKSFTFL